MKKFYYVATVNYKGMKEYYTPEEWQREELADRWCSWVISIPENTDIIGSISHIGRLSHLDAFRTKKPPKKPRTSGMSAIEEMEPMRYRHRRTAETAQYRAVRWGWPPAADEAGQHGGGTQDAADIYDAGR